MEGLDGSEVKGESGKNVVGEVTHNKAHSIYTSFYLQSYLVLDDLMLNVRDKVKVLLGYIHNH